MRKYHDDYEEETTSENQFLTPQEVMDILCIGRNTFYRLVNSGALKAFRIGTLWRVKREDLEVFGA